MDDMSSAPTTEVSVPVGLITDIYTTSTDLRVWAWFAASIAGLVGSVESTDAVRTSATIAEAARELNISVPTVNRSVSTLDGAGWITRTRVMGTATLTEVHHVPLTKDQIKARTKARKDAEKDRERAQQAARRAAAASRRPVGRPRRA